MSRPMRNRDRRSGVAAQIISPQPGIRQLHNEQTRQAENIRRERTTHCAPRTGDLTTAIEGSKALLDYSMTKGGIHAFTKSLSAQLIDRGIRVNAVTPGAVWTPLYPADRPPEEMAKFRAAPRWAARRSPRRSRPPSFSWRRRPARATSPARFCRSSAAMGEPQAEAARRHGHDADTPSPSRRLLDSSQTSGSLGRTATNRLTAKKSTVTM